MNVLPATTARGGASRSPMADRIRAITADAHRRAEAAVRAFDPFASRARYAAYLETLYRFYAHLEPALERYLDTSGRRKLAWIEADLVDLGRGPTRRPCPLDVSIVRSRAAAFGVAYVLEGKTLGSRFLCAEAQEKLGADVPITFFTGYGPGTGRMWNAFKQALETHALRAGGRLSTVRAALTTFGSFTSLIGSTLSSHAR